MLSDNSGSDSKRKTRALFFLIKRCISYQCRSSFDGD